MGHSPEGRKESRRDEVTHSMFANFGIASQWISPQNLNGVFYEREKLIVIFREDRGEP